MPLGITISVTAGTPHFIILFMIALSGTHTCKPFDVAPNLIPEAVCTPQSVDLLLTISIL